jgi:hypothetical protein
MTMKARTVIGSIVELQPQIEGITVKDLKFARPTLGMTVTSRAFSKFSHLFDYEGRPASEILHFSHGGYAWKLYAHKISSGRITLIRIYGVCGDYSFGHTPSYMKSSLGGNKRAARAIYTEFLHRLVEKRGVIIGAKFGF